MHSGEWRLETSELTHVHLHSSPKPQMFGYEVLAPVCTNVFQSLRLQRVPGLVNPKRENSHLGYTVRTQDPRIVTHM